MSSVPFEPEAPPQRALYMHEVYSRARLALDLVSMSYRESRSWFVVLMNVGLNCVPVEKPPLFSLRQSGNYVEWRGRRLFPLQRWTDALRRNSNARG